MSRTTISVRPKFLDAALIVPDHEKRGDRYPGNIKPGFYWPSELIALLRKHKRNPKAIQFIADMME